MEGRIFQLNRSGGGVPKLAVRETFLDANGLEGDRQRNLRFHGGPERALCLFPLELILELQAEGHPIFPGSVGENVTVAGLEWSRVEPGARLSLRGGARAEIKSHTPPCATTPPPPAPEATSNASRRRSAPAPRAFTRASCAPAASPSATQSNCFSEVARPEPH